MPDKSCDCSAQHKLDACEGAIRFAEYILRKIFEGGDVDGCDAQDEAERLGLTALTRYDPEIHSPDSDVEPGDPWYTFSPAFDALLETIPVRGRTWVSNPDGTIVPPA